MGLIASIYYNKSYRNCAAGGISERFEEVTIVNAEGPFDPTPERPAVKLVAMDLRPKHVYAVPVVEGGEFFQWSMGGSYISTSDSRFSEALTRLGGIGSVAVQLHDRREF